MLRMEIDYPKVKIIDLIDEYEDFLEDNDMVDEREKNRIDAQAINEKQNDDNKEAADDEDGPDIEFNPLDA